MCGAVCVFVKRVVVARGSVYSIVDDPLYICV